MSVPTFLLPHEALNQSVAVIAHEEFRHLRARRVRAGDLVRLIDGRGTARLARVQRVLHDRAVVQLEETVTPQRESPLETTLAMALIRPERVEIAVEKATELGVTRIVLFRSARSRTYDPTPRLPRWRRIVSEATKQCQRTTVPALDVVPSLQRLLAQAGPGLCAFFHAATPEEECLDLATCPPPSAFCAVIGPEGGFADDEVALLRQSGCAPARLGPRILRTETAAVAVLALAQCLWGDWRQQPQS